MDSPVVEVAEGKLKGTILKNYDGEKVFSFFGVPFAKPPVNELRFKAPVPIEPWTGIRDATKEGDKCIQQDIFDKTIVGSENCLHLNIYTRELTSKLKPVMFWIHGGAFLFGSNNTDFYGPDYLLTEDIVLVTTNYRLGILGFLDLNNPSLNYDRNVGLKDQLLALKWVQKNIASFSGDPNNVTIFGESAGSASVHYHVISPQSKGLFHKAIMQSGTLMSNWASPNKFSLMDFVKLLGKEVGNENEAFEVLKSVNVNTLHETAEAYLANFSSTSLVFHPVSEEGDKNGFVVAEPIKLITSGNYNKVPLMLGYTSNEGLYFEISKRVKAARGDKIPESNNSIEQFLPKKLIEEGSEVVKNVTDKIQQVYFTGENAKNPVMILSDVIFTVGAINTAKVNAKVSKEPAFLYEITIDDELNLFKKAGKSEDLPGTSHADELGYLFSTHHLPLPKKGSSAERAMRSFVRLWTNFAKYGNPTPKQEELNVSWKPVNTDSINYLEIGEELKLKKNPLVERVLLWDEIYKLSM